VGWVVEVRRQQHRPFTVSSSAPTTIGFAGGHFLALPRYDDRGAHRHFRDGKWSLVITSSVPAHTSGRRCLFHSEAEYHQVADSTLQDIQDAIDEAFDKISNSGSAPDSSSSLVSPAAAEYELTLASGVLTLGLPGHGTWVLNKQTPNRQIWWSSPLSGPKRFEYLEGSWCSTKDGLALGPLLVQELRHVHPWLEIELRL
jgi:frataxin